MNVALVGSSGYIASYIIQRLEKESDIDSILKIDRDEKADIKLNLTEAEKFNYDCLNNIDCVVFTAAISGPDKCAEEFDYCWNINVIGTSYFIEKAIEKNCRVLFFSSDAVFGDISGHIYDELSETNAETPYGKMKKAVEDKFKGNDKFKAIRLSYVASVRDRFISYCLECVTKHEEADIFHPFYRNVIVVSDVVNVVMWFINNWSKYKPNVLNVAGKELVSRVRMADEINRYLGNKLKYKISIPDKSFYENRPPITQMKSIYMKEYEILEDNTFTEKIQKELKIIK